MSSKSTSRSRGTRRSAPAEPRASSRRPETIADLQGLLRWAEEHGVAVETIGLGSNLLVHDDGVDALVLRLAGELATAQSRASCSSRVEARRTPSACTARAPRGSAASSSPRAIPGTAGGGVRMNAGAYGRDWRAVVVDAVVVDARRAAHGRPRRPRPRLPALGPRAGEVVAQVRFRLEPSSPEAVKATAAELLAQRKATQPTNKRTFGSVFKNPDGERGRAR